MRQLSQTLVRLNVETRSFHADADAPWLDLVAPGRATTRFDYVQHLVQQYGFDAPLEAAAAYTPHLDSFIDVHPRFRAGHIAKDLVLLGVRPGELANLRQAMIAPFASVAEAFGWLYVHQRSTLLHKAVLGVLLERLPDVQAATAALSFDGGHIGGSWDQFGMAVDHAARTTMIEDRIISAARDAFRLLIDWNTRASRETRQATYSRA